MSLPLRLMFYTIVSISLSASLSWAGYYEGYEAYSRGDYEVSRQEWIKVAEQDSSFFSSDIPEDAEVRNEMGDARYALGLLYWNGKGVEQSYVEASAWLRKAAEIGHADAQLKLGYMYINGKGIPQDYAKAKQWLAKSAEQGNMDAQYNLAVLHYKGLGSDRDLHRAQYWFGKAAAQGDKISSRVLADMKKRHSQQMTRTHVAATQMPKPAMQIHPSTLQKSSMVQSPPRHGMLLSPAWLATKSDSHYTIQLIAVSKKAGLENLAHQHAPYGPFAHYTKQKSGLQLYVLVQGDYSSLAEAKVALYGYPDSLKKNKPFITKIGAIRKFLP